MVRSASEKNMRPSGRREPVGSETEAPVSFATARADRRAADNGMPKVFAHMAVTVDTYQVRFIAWRCVCFIGRYGTKM